MALTLSAEFERVRRRAGRVSSLTDAQTSPEVLLPSAPREANFNPTPLPHLHCYPLGAVRAASNERVPI
eukprot:745995-Hanusia_phi.AAC.3